MAGHDHSRVALSDTTMSTGRRSLIAILVLAASLPGQTLKQIATIDLPGPKGRFDYLTTDNEDQFLLSAHLGPGILYVIDMKTNKLVKGIPGVPGITGLEFVPETRKVEGISLLYSAAFRRTMLFRAFSLYRRFSR